MKKLDKLKISVDKKLLLFLIVLGIIGIIAGSILVCIINTGDKTLLKEYLTNFLNNVDGNNIDYFLAFKSNIFNSMLYLIGIWLLGMSVIGLPIILFMYFLKTFILGFSIGSIIYTYGIKGTLFALIYTFPGQIINVLCLTIIMMYAISFSMRLIDSIFKKKTINFKIIMNKYLIILLVTFIITLLMVLYDTYLMPKIVKSIITFIK